MASAAQLQAQIRATDLALASLRTTAARTDLSPVDRAQVDSAIRNLQAERQSLLAQRTALTQENNPPNPQVPASPGPPLSIDIQGVGQEPVNDPLVGTDSSPPLVRIELPPAQVIPEIDADAAQRTTGRGITGPVEGISPFGEEDEPLTAERVINPAPQPQTDPQANRFVFDDNGELIPADSVQAEAETRPQPQASAAQDPQNPGFVFNEEGELIPADSAEANRIRSSQPEAQIDPYTAVTGSGDPILTDDEIDAIRADQQIVFGPDGLTTLSAEEAARQSATLAQARAQWIIQQQRKQANDGDWRVRLRLAPNSDYLYNADDPGPLLQPLKATDGVIFPYTPQIVQAYRANYSSYDLTHSNYRGYFYQNSYLDDIQLNATFTAQDTNEANYMLAVITFFKSVTKMFYGRDANRGVPPPLVFLQGLGRYQFNLNPCVVAQFNYTLPDDVDYIRALSPNINGTNQTNLRQGRQALPTNPFSSAVSRIKNLLQPQLGTGLSQYNKPPPPTLGTNSPTYVPTRIDISLILHPMQSRQQVSQDFSLKDFANGSLIEKGFW